MLFKWRHSWRQCRKHGTSTHGYRSAQWTTWGKMWWRIFLNIKLFKTIKFKKLEEKGDFCGLILFIVFYLAWICKKGTSKKKYYDNTILMEFQAFKIKTSPAKFKSHHHFLEKRFKKKMKGRKKSKLNWYQVFSLIAESIFKWDLTTSQPLE